MGEGVRVPCPRLPAGSWSPPRSSLRPSMCPGPCTALEARIPHACCFPQAPWDWVCSLLSMSPCTAWGDSSLASGSPQTYVLAALLPMGIPLWIMPTGTWAASWTQYCPGGGESPWLLLLAPGSGSAASYPRVLVTVLPRGILLVVCRPATPPHTDPRGWQPESVCPSPFTAHGDFPLGAVPWHLGVRLQPPIHVS